jgi:hypothetical protein
MDGKSGQGVFQYSVSSLPFWRHFATGINGQLAADARGCAQIFVPIAHRKTASPPSGNTLRGRVPGFLLAGEEWEAGVAPCFGVMRFCRERLLCRCVIWNARDGVPYTVFKRIAVVWARFASRRG